MRLPRLFVAYVPLIVSIAFAAETSTAAPTIPEDVKANVQERVSGGAAPGIVVGIIGPDGAEAYHTAGPVTPDTIFEIGSITKSFTGILLAEMASRGEVKLSDPVRKYLPETVTLPKEGDREITLEDLATQRSGLPRMPANFEPADPADPFVDYTAERLYAYLPKATLVHPIGTTYDYSNLGMGLLGHALSRAAKMDYDALVKARIATPLGMTVTSVSATPTQASAKPWTWNTSSALTGAGGLRSTAREMLRFLKANAGVPDSPLGAAMKEAQRPRAEAGSKAMAIGLAWHLKRSGERVLVWHNGATGGFHSFCGFDPVSRTGVVVLASSTEDIDDIGFHLLEPAEPLKTVVKTVVLEEAKLARLDGFYDIGGATIHVSHEGKQLYAQLTAQPRFPVFPKSETLFFYRVVPAELEFAVQEDGSVNQVTLHQGGRDVAGKRVAAAIEPKARAEVPIDPKLLAEYAGRYQLAPGIEFTVTVQDGKLGVQLTGQQRLEVYPESDTKFFYKVVDAQIGFVRGASGKVEALILHQNGRDQRANRVN